jgi:GrpB-like predicted nucleotidyltransferase (UPF0157 family)
MLSGSNCPDDASVPPNAGSRPPLLQVVRPTPASRRARLNGVLNAEDLDVAGLGLEYGWVRLVRVPPAWAQIGDRLAGELETVLGGAVIRAEPIGSTSVPDMLAKPIIDVAIGTASHANLADIIERLSEHQWIYRGDAGDQGGHVFVLESRVRYRVAHAHVVDHDGEQWRRYLALRETLRASAEARHRYSIEKQRLVAELGQDNSAGAYTSGKSPVVNELLR